MGEVPKAAEAVAEKTEQRSAEVVGAERGRAAAEWMSKRWEGAKSIASKGGRFLKKIGLAALAPDVAAKNVGREVGGVALDAGMAVGKGAVEGGKIVAGIGKDMAAATAEAGVALGVGAAEAYKFTSEATKAGARVAAESMTAGWNKTVEATNSVYAAGKERVSAVREKGREYMAARAERIHDKQLRKEMAQIQEKYNLAAEEMARGEDIIKSGMVLIESNKQLLGELGDMLAQLKERKGVQATA